GKGSTFTLTLPSRFAPQPAALEPSGEIAEPVAELSTVLAPDVASPAPADAVHPQVLVVEDNPVASLQIRSALEEHGYRVQSASGGEEGLACVRAQAPDGIVLDLMMPGIDGFEVLEQIRSTPETATLPVLILTAKELTAEDRARLSHNNISQLIQKGSVDREQLVAAVDRLTRRHIEPEAIPEKIPLARAGQAAIRWKDTGQRPILIVEDNPDNRLTLQALLDELGYRHIAAEDGAQAVRVAREESPALILMDIHLPVLSGLDATRQIKADPSFREIPIIALTARAMKGDRENFLVAGCDDYLAKPIAPEALAKILDKWMGGEDSQE
ncbi:MAG: response regulator, partial [Desulfuromonadales bacterium]|nr:response regulator [Desulfuromonadales bacterium]